MGDKSVWAARYRVGKRERIDMYVSGLSCANREGSGRGARDDGLGGEEDEVSSTHTILG